MVVIVPVSLWVENVCCNSRSPRPVEAIKLVRALERLKLTFVKFSQTARTVHPHHTRASSVMNSFQETQSDLEVILEFLEEYYRQHTGGNVDKMYWTAVEPGDDGSAPVDEGWCEQRWTGSEPATSKPELEPLLAHDAPPALCQKTTTTTTTPLCERGSLTNFVSTRQPTKHRAGSGGKVRLFHFLFEVLEDANMAHCVSWVPEAAAGVFRFSSTNKDQVAVLWGQRKGNKRPMTYQKMSRALRNYGRSGEIFKVKKKLTYQFSRETLTRLRKCERGDL
ncbi:transcription factor Spi-B [Cyclopterus lumpus]|uniref:transcription factor Spi-B n=1 Tax=Cyclopterus lumpus TaxID=8103 RepID=UPI001485C48E|nr:transcription factor Spi-B [Cyclopterus lumpus]